LRKGRKVKMANINAKNVNDEDRDERKAKDLIHPRLRRLYRKLE
jgi:hypothetical protein